jgi:hypothetical protein
MGQIANGLAHTARTYTLKTQSGYDGSDREYGGKLRKDIHWHPEDAERIRWVR